MNKRTSRGPRSLINVSLAELRILTLLLKNKGGLYASQFIPLSNGFFARGSIYITLSRLEQKGFIDHTIVAATPRFNLDRPRYHMTKDGKVVLKDFAKEFGFTWHPSSPPPLDYIPTHQVGKS